MTVTARDVRAARAAVETVARRTPILSTRTFSERAGGTVVLKAENLQRTGSFKVRGVAAKLDALGDGLRERRRRRQRRQPRPGARRRRGRRAASRARSSSPSTRRWRRSRPPAAQGAIVHVGGNSVDACLITALERAEEGGLAFVHPFDDPAIVAGQGSLGLELLEDVPGPRPVVVPVGGGGLCAGIALVIKDAKPDVKIIGVQAAACAPYPESMAGGEPIEAKTALTIADGIAVKRPGGIPLEILRTHLDDMVVVDEEATAEAMALLLERCKLVVEGAGAVGVAAILGGQVEPIDGTTVAVLSGGNIDAACSRRSPAATRPSPAAGSSRSPASPTGRAASPRCSRRSPAPARTSSTSATSARASTCTCARRRSSWCWRRAATTTRSGCCRSSTRRATRPRSCADKLRQGWATGSSELPA